MCACSCRAGLFCRSWKTANPTLRTAPVDDDGTFRKPYAVLPTYDAVPENVYNGPPIVAALDENA